MIEASSVWQPNDYATNTLVAAYIAYFSGGSVSSPSDLIYVSDPGVLFASFGRALGHSTSISRYTKMYPDKKHLVVVENTNLASLMRSALYVDSNVQVITQRRAKTFARGCRVDSIFLDLSFETYASEASELLSVLQPVHNDIAVILSDGRSTQHYRRPVPFDFRLPSSELSRFANVFDLSPA